MKTWTTKVLFFSKSVRKDVEFLKYILEEVRKNEEKEKIPVIRMEIDYELLTLYDALQAEDKVQIIKSKEKLKLLRKKLLSLLDK
ncbi:hypothetical protein [Paucisalibacillus globulus]|jgi:hypothetical protein|uniref:hypothetical protein n=1 Tax=Paucisalibacillus globulus TaxID=351095 RepID=UPI0027961B4A|nr:hypothetical protein [Paucisalibacillus globulus]